jgi:hypothetical protein
MQVVRKRTLVIAAFAAVSVIAPVSEALRVAPLKTRDAVVVTWRPQNNVAVVAQPNGNLLAIHSLRKVSPGTRVTVGGIKWGTPTSGIKWGTPGQGIKWGIKWGRNGSYTSPITKRAGKKAVWTPVRGPVVKKSGKQALAIGTPGGVVVIRIPQRVATGKATQATDALPPVGARISVRVYFTKKGARIGRDLKYLKPPVPGASLPFAGTVVAIDPVTRTMVVEDAQDPSYPMRMTVALPTEFTLTPYSVGQEVAVAGTVTGAGTLSLTTIGPNGDFTKADDPQTVQILTTGEPACANAVETSCPNGTTPPPAIPTVQAPPGGQDAPPPSSSSPSTPPAPSGDTAPTTGNGGGSQGGGATPPLPAQPICRPGKDDDVDETHRGRGESKGQRSARHGGCVPRPCSVASRGNDDTHRPCRPVRVDNARTTTGKR